MGDWWDVSWPSPLGDGGISNTMKRQEVLLKGGEAYERLKMVRELVLLPVFFFSYTTPSYKKAWFKRMSEAIISRRGWGTGGKPELQTKIFYDNENWVVPNSLRGNISVRIFGAGGAGYSTGCGGGGWMNNAEISVNKGESIPITIGRGGSGTRAGGTSSFGEYLSANGGSSGNARTGGSGGSGGGSSNGNGGTGYQFGGGGSFDGDGGDGGIWGGGGGAAAWSDDSASGGNGGMYGGGAGSAGSYAPGHGGWYGGGGGGGIRYSHGDYNVISGAYGGWNSADNTFSGLAGNGGTNSRGENGTNTIGWTNVANLNGILITGHGRGGAAYREKDGNYASGGGGGFGGNGSAAKSQTGGSGGGYGGHAGTCGNKNTGGGGGYGGNGGNASQGGGGGGGGYGRGADGGKGGSISSWSGGGGGGGYFAKGGDFGGGASYGQGGSRNILPGYGGGGYSGQDGGDGICIIQYYA